MATNSSYNGWTNYATWRVNLEICEDVCRMYVEDRTRFDSVNDLADALKESVDESLTNYGEITEGLALDYARSFVSDVNYYEIAKHYEDELISTDEDNDEDA